MWILITIISSLIFASAWYTGYVVLLNDTAIAVIVST